MELAATIGTAGLPSAELVTTLERAGFHSFWTAEDWGSDAVSQLAWVGSHTTRIKLGTSIMQVPARSPAMTAMTAATLSNLSDGRFILGIGPSGPQVAEGWHGTPYRRPLARLRSYVDIVQNALARHEPLTVDDDFYQLPTKGPGATGLGKPLRLNTRVEHDVPIYISAMGPTALQLGAEIADGVIATLLHPDHHNDVETALAAGLGISGRRREDFTLVAHVPVITGPSVGDCLDQLRPAFARTIGGYGAKEQNFYLNQISRAGWAAEAERVQELYLAGHRADAAAALPDELLDTYSLVGPPDRITRNIDRYTNVDILMLGTADTTTLQTVAAAR